MAGQARAVLIAEVSHPAIIWRSRACPAPPAYWRRLLATSGDVLHVLELATKESFK